MNIFKEIYEAIEAITLLVFVTCQNGKHQH